MKIFIDANICLDLLDTSRNNSFYSINWVGEHIEDEFYFSFDFVTTIFYVLVERKKLNKKLVLKSIDEMMSSFNAVFLNRDDYENAKRDFDIVGDFEDLLVLHSAIRSKCKIFLTNDKKLLALQKFKNIKIISPKGLQ